MLLLAAAAAAAAVAAAARPDTAELTPALPIHFIFEVIHVVAYFAALFEDHKYVALSSNYAVNGYNLYFAVWFKRLVFPGRAGVRKGVAHGQVCLKVNADV